MTAAATAAKVVIGAALYVGFVTLLLRAMYKRAKAYEATHGKPDDSERYW